MTGEIYSHLITLRKDAGMSDEKLESAVEFRRLLGVPDVTSARALIEGAIAEISDNHQAQAVHAALGIKVSPRATLTKRYDDLKVESLRALETIRKDSERGFKQLGVILERHANRSGSSSLMTAQNNRVNVSMDTKRLRWNLSALGTQINGTTVNYLIQRRMTFRGWRVVIGVELADPCHPGYTLRTAQDDVNRAWQVELLAVSSTLDQLEPMARFHVSYPPSLSGVIERIIDAYVVWTKPSIVLSIKDGQSPRMRWRGTTDRWTENSRTLRVNVSHGGPPTEIQALWTQEAELALDALEWQHDG